MIAFRQADSRYPFLWESPSQPPGRWHGAGEGPAHYLADTPDGAWAELLRHEEITDPADVATVRRALWAVDLRDEPFVEVDIARDVATGGRQTYAQCQQRARELRQSGATRLAAPSAALAPGGAHGWRVESGQVSPGPARDGRTLVVFEDPGTLVGWPAVLDGSPPANLLGRVRYW